MPPSPAPQPCRPARATSLLLAPSSIPCRVPPLAAHSITAHTRHAQLRDALPHRHMHNMRIALRMNEGTHAEQKCQKANWAAFDIQHGGGVATA